MTFSNLVGEVSNLACLRAPTLVGGVVTPTPYVTDLDSVKCEPQLPSESTRQWVLRPSAP